jgi:hypothetical protein
MLKGSFMDAKEAAPERQKPLDIALELFHKVYVFRKRLAVIEENSSLVREEIFRKVHKDYRAKLTRFEEEYHRFAERYLADRERFEAYRHERVAHLDRLNLQWEEFYLRFLAGQFTDRKKAEVEEKYYPQKEHLQEIIEHLDLMAREAYGETVPPSSVDVVTEEVPLDHDAEAQIGRGAVLPAAEPKEEEAVSEPARPLPELVEGPAVAPAEAANQAASSDEGESSAETDGTETVFAVFRDDVLGKSKPQESTPAPSASSRPRAATPRPLAATPKPGGEGQYTRMQKLADIFGTDDLASLESMQGAEPAAPDKELPVLIFQAGALAPRRHHLTEPRLTLGRVRDNTIQIPKDSSVSRYHAEITQVGDTYVVKDLNSSNGTLLNGKLIAPSATLVNGDVIRLGETEIVFIDDPGDPRSDG